MIRKFYLENSKGESWNLNNSGEKRVLFHTLAGLGYTNDSSYYQKNYDFEVDVKSFSQDEVQGNLFFSNPNAYKNYFEFANFCQMSPLVLKYETDAGLFEKRVEIGKLEKSEIEHNGLNCPVTFKSLTLWLKRKAPVTAVYSSASDSYSLEVDNSSNLPAMVKLTFELEGVFSNPFWSWYDDNLREYTGKVNATFYQNRCLEVSNLYSDYKIVNYVFHHPESFTSIYHYSDFLTKRFIEVPPNTFGFLINFKVENENAAPVIIKAEVAEQYVSV